MNAAIKSPESQVIAKVSVKRRDLLRAVSTILPVIERRNTIPILGCLMIGLSENRIDFSGTNMDQHLFYGFAVEAVGCVRVALERPHSLAALLRKIPFDTIDLEIVEQRSRASPVVMLNYGTSSAEFSTQSPDDALDVPTGDMVAKMQFGGAQLMEAIDRVAFAISSEESRYYLNGIYLHARRDAMGDLKPCLVATDGHRLGLALVGPDIDLPAPQWPDESGYIIPREAVPMLRSIAKQGAVSLEIYSRDRGHKTKDGKPLIEALIRAQSGAHSLVTKTIAGAFPDYERVIPSGNDRFAVLAPVPLRAALDRIIAISSDKKWPQVSVEIDQLSITLKTRNIEGGAITESIDLPEAPNIGVNEKFFHGVNGRYFVDLLKTFPGAVTYRWSSPASPIVIHDADAASLSDASHIVVQMPMRV